MSDFKNQSPWGSPPGGGNGDGFRRGPTPPDIDEIIRTAQEKIKKFWVDHTRAIEKFRRYRFRPRWEYYFFKLLRRNNF